MPAVVPLLVDSDAIEQGAIYSEESTWAYATNEVSMSSSNFADVPSLTINLMLSEPATVLQIAQIDFRTNAALAAFEARILRSSTVGGVQVHSAPRYGTHWQNAFLMWAWPGLAAGNHTFKVQCTKGTIASRKHILIVMRI